jgi:hypothetical protein
MNGDDDEEPEDDDEREEEAVDKGGAKTGLTGMVLQTPQATTNPTPSTVTAASVTQSMTSSNSRGIWICNAKGGMVDLFALQTKTRDDTVKTIVKDTLFRKVKFVVEEEHLRWDFKSFATPILEGIMKDIATATDADKQAVWEDVMPIARKALNSRRTSVNGSVKDAVVGE